MLNNPTVSVVIAAYGSAKYLNQAVESVEQQTWQDYELIVVDDASPADVVADYRLPSNATLICLSENHGVAAPGRNVGIAASRGRYIAFLDMDDVWLRDKLEAQVALLESNPNAGLVYSHAVLVDDDLESLNMRKKYRAVVDDPARRLAGGCLIGAPAAVMVRREVFDEVGVFDESLPTLADWDMWCRIARKFAFLEDTENRLLYRVRPGQASKNFRKTRPAAVLILEKMMEWAKTERPDLLRVIRRRLSWSLNRHARLSMDTDDDLTTARDALLKAKKLYPWIPRTYWLLLKCCIKSRLN